MYGFAIGQCYHPQISAQLRNQYPEADSVIIGLGFVIDRIVLRQLAPFSSEIRALAQDLFLKVARGLHRSHQFSGYQFSRMIEL
jgi:hypothetical protein